MTGLVSAVDIDFDCPEEIFVNEEFVCELEVFDGDDYYDVKIELDQERNSILEVYDGEKWVSGYYYLKEFIEDGESEDVILRVSEIGNHDGFLKLRQGSKREFFEIEIDVDENGFDYAEDVFEEIEEVVVEEGVDKGDEIIFLTGNVIQEESEFDYVSKDGRVADYLIYGFCIFLIFVIGVLLWDRAR
jgi:hypothetical protein